MKNLLKADFRRLTKDVGTIIVGGIMLGYLLIMLLINGTMGGTSVQLGSTMISETGVSELGLFFAIAVSIYNCKEFKYNTIRNKITAGYTRSQIYFSTMIVDAVLFAVFLVASQLLILGLGLIFFDISFSTLFILDYFASIFATFCFACMVAFFTMAVRSGSGSLVFGILIAIFAPMFGMAFAGFYFNGLLEVFAYDMATNYLFYEIMTRINPFAYSFVITSFPLLSYALDGLMDNYNLFIAMWYVNMFGVSALFGGGFIALGWNSFRKADIK